MRLQGVAFRAHDPRWSFKPLSGEGAALYGGRFNRKDMPALYRALDATTAVREITQALARKFDPCLLCSYDYDCENAGLLTPSFAPGATESAHNLVLWKWGRRGSATCRNYGQIRENITNDRLATKAYGGQ